jgi:hypothetical protein
MKPLPAPPRLLEPGSGAPDVVRTLLDHGASELPDAGQLARLALRLPHGAPPPSGGGTLPAPTPIAHAGAPASLAGPAVGLAIALAAIAAALMYNAAPAPVSAPPITVTAAATPSAAEPVVAASGEPRRESAEDEVAAGAAPRSPIAGAGTPVAVGPATRSGAVGAAIKPPLPPAAASSEPSGEREVDLLQRAQAAGPAEALAIVREHEQRFPGGTLVQEREVIAVKALVSLGLATEARARAMRFVALYPRSAYRGRIETLVPGLSTGAPAAAGTSTVPSPRLEER